jgi:hypothetical protein
MRTAKKKQTSVKKKLIKKFSKIQPPTPEEGWELVDKNDPRLKELPCMPRRAMRRRGKWSWSDSSYNKGEEIHDAVLRRVSQYYALPIDKIEKPAVKAPCSIRLRLPSEKPKANDCDWNTHIYIRNTKGDVWVKWVWYTPMPEGTICWIPGRITDAELADLPKPVTQEDIWRAEGEKIWPEISGELLANNENGSKEVFLRGYLAAKKGK